MNNASLQDLHDIVLPQAPGIWPLAIGWWLLIAILIISAAFLIKTLVNYSQQWKIKRLAIAKLNTCKDCNDINQLIKQVAIHYCDDANISSLTGNNWVDFIDRNLSISSKSELIDINNALYTPHHADFFDQYKIIAAQWLSNLNKRALINLNTQTLVNLNTDKNVERNNANL